MTAIDLSKPDYGNEEAREEAAKLIADRAEELIYSQPHKVKDWTIENIRAALKAAYWQGRVDELKESGCEELGYIKGCIDTAFEAQRRTA